MAITRLFSSEADTGYISWSNLRHKSLRPGYVPADIVGVHPVTRDLLAITLSSRAFMRPWTRSAVRPRGLQGRWVAYFRFFPGFLGVTSDLAMVGEAGLEPTTPGLEGRCSIQLSYSPVFAIVSPSAPPRGYRRASMVTARARSRGLAPSLCGMLRGRATALAGGKRNGPIRFRQGFVTESKKSSSGFSAQ